jgi:hypothetical protein
VIPVTTPSARYRQARSRVALAGRELGSGPKAAVDLLCPGMIEALTEAGIREAHQMRADWHRRQDEGSEGAEKVLRQLGHVDEDAIRERVGQLVYGLAIGLVMAEDPWAMQVLERIEGEWRESHSA